jgi:energy-coupling factor transport system ATP-binding protein
VEQVIELKNVSYRYPHAETESLKNIELTVTKGKFVVIMGRTGAGKTTLSLILNGLIPQLMEGEFTGEVRVAGKETSKHRVQDLAKQVGLVLQDAESQIVGRTVEEDVAFGPRNFGLPLEEIWEKVDQALKKVRLEGYIGRSTAELSGGEKQRLAIAGVLALEPEIMVLDEPTSELDPEGRVEIYRALDNLCCEKNHTLLVVEHSSEEILRRADEIIVLNHGEIVWKGAPEELFRNIPLLHEFGIKPLPMSLLGWEYYQKGWIDIKDIPLDVESAEFLIRRLINKGKNLNGIHQLARHSVLRDAPQERIRIKPSNDSPLITIEHLVHQYESGQTALQGIDLVISKGEFVALVGSNGAGKTTLAKHLNGLLKPTEGEVSIQGMNTKEYDTAYLARTIGYVFQNPDHQIFSTSVEKELEYGLKNVGFGSEEIKERTQRALELTSLEKFRKVHPYTLGKGERQLIAVASVLALAPEVLVIDEPTTGLDWSGVQKIMELLRQLHEKGTTILMISHDMDIVAEYAQRVIVMQKGCILRDAPTWEALGDFEVLRQAAILPPQICALSQRLMDFDLSRPKSAEDFRTKLMQVLEEENKILCL